MQCQYVCATTSLLLFIQFGCLLLKSFAVVGCFHVYIYFMKKKRISVVRFYFASGSENESTLRAKRHTSCELFMWHLWYMKPTSTVVICEYKTTVSLSMIQIIVYRSHQKNIEWEKIIIIYGLWISKIWEFCLLCSNGKLCWLCCHLRL